MQNCSTCNDVKDFTCTYIENYNDRGKYSLSEREYLWNHRFQGTVVSICKRPSYPKWPAPPCIVCIPQPTNMILSLLMFYILSSILLIGY